MLDAPVYETMEIATNSPTSFRFPTTSPTSKITSGAASLPTPNTVSEKITNPQEFSTQNSGKYNINSLVYPIGLSENLDMAHYVTFFINVRGKSKYFANKPSNIVGVAPDKSGTTTAAQNMQIIKTGAGVVWAAVGAKMVPGGAWAKVAGALVAGGAAYGTAEIASKNITLDSTYRISDCITLHINEAPTVSYGIKYSSEELGTALALASGPSALAQSEGQWAAAAATLNKFGDKNFNTAVRKVSGQTLNPFKEILFESVEFRRFEFNYVFMPKSQTESNNIREIVDTFKSHMHPELSAQSFFYINPSEFNISYYYAGKENKYFNRIATCALTDMTVTYGGEKFASFNDGAPVEVHMKLVFQELSPVTRDSIEKEGF